MNSRTSRSRGAVVIAVVAVLASACSGGSGGSSHTGKQAASPRKGGDKIVVIAQSDPGTLDYVQSNLTAVDLWIPGNVVEPLITVDAAGKYGPGVAESWSVTKDQRTYTFHIRKAKFSSGAPITAADVVYSMEQMQASPVGANKSPYQTVTKITATDPSTVKVTLSRPSLAFMQGMAGNAGVVQPKADAASRATKPIGSGPYVVQTYAPNNQIVLRANSTYWGPKPAIREVDIKFIKNTTAALNALEAGEADAYPAVGTDLFERLAKDGLDKRFTVQTSARGATMYWINFNDTKAPYNNATLRHALAKSVDRKAFAEVFNAPKVLVPTCTYAIDPTSAWFEKASASSCVDAYDPKAAKTELGEGGFSGTQLDFSSVTDISDLVPLADLAAAEFSAVGAKVKRNQMDLARYSQVVFNGSPPQYGLTIMSTQYDITEMASCPDPAKVGWKTYCSKAATALLAKADAAPTKAEQDKLFEQASEQIQKDAVFVPLMLAKGVSLLNPSVHGWKDPTVDIAINLSSLHW